MANRPGTLRSRAEGMFQLMVNAGSRGMRTRLALPGSSVVKMIWFGASDSGAIGFGKNAGMVGGLSANAAVVRNPAARTKAVMVFDFMRVG